MKNYILFLFLFLIYNLSGQRNEIQIVYQEATENSDLRSGVALTYFINFTEHSAIGARFNINFRNTDKLLDGQRYVAGIDLVQRWNLIKNSRFRVMPEFGISYLRSFQRSDYAYIDCIFCYPVETESFFRNLNYLGGTVGLSIDLRISKSIIIGTGYHFSDYKFNNWNFLTEKLRKRSYSFFTTIRF